MGAPSSRATDTSFTWSQPLLRGLGPNASLYDLRNARRAQEDVRALQQQHQDLDRELQDEIAGVQSKFEPGAIELEVREIAPKKADTKVEQVVLLWWWWWWW